MLLSRLKQHTILTLTQFKLNSHFFKGKLKSFKSINIRTIHFNVIAKTWQFRLLNQMSSQLKREDDKVFKVSN